MKTLASIVSLVAIFLLFPASALAQAGVVNPLGSNAWDLYVYGNGSVVFATLNGIKMLMVPDVGTSGFNTLLLLLATVGFLVLAVGAGFDPSKNLMRMFTYILVVWGVSFASTQLTTNINVIDMVGTEAGQQRVYTVSGVPAIVGLPAALVSEVGRYFTEVIEAYFNSPTEFKMTAGAAGQFNLFAKMLDDTMRFRIGDPNLRQSVSAYTADCVIPAMARGVFGFCRDRSDTCARDSALWVAGREALTSAPSYLELLASARHNSIMTTYWPARARGETEGAWVSRIQSPSLRASLTSGDDLSITAARARQMGVVLSCNEAFMLIAHDADAHAQDLYEGSSAAWARTGTQVPFEQTFQAMMSNVAAPGAPAAGFSRPSGFILQQAMINSSAGTFRAAAAQTGNNEIMQAAALAQAEAQQRSTWVASFHMFNNMMGYVYSVLQAFIFAVTPIVVVALMVPGLGKSIFTNYAQILVWLTLWMPMLALINFMITMFALDSVQGITVFSDGAITAGNSGQISERLNNLIIAAQFLGTMTPLITWGLVKGTLAFTEFISQGMGSAFASQAGAAAASGNMSLNNMSMDNTSTNKFNTQMSSAVGFQTISAPMNAGALAPTANLGGSEATTGANTAVQSAASLAHRASMGAQSMRQAAQAMAHTEGTEQSWTSLMRQAYSQSNTAARDTALATVVSAMRNAGVSDAGIVALAAAAEANTREGADVGSSARSGVEGSAGGGLRLKVGKVVNLGAEANAVAATGDQVGQTHATGTGTTSAKRSENTTQGAAGSTAATGQTGTTTNSQRLSDEEVRSLDRSNSNAVTEARSRAVSALNQQAETLSRAAEVAQTMAVNRDVDLTTLRNLENQINALDGRIPSAGAMTGGIAGTERALGQGFADAQARAFGANAQVEEGILQGRGAAVVQPGLTGVRGDAANITAQAEAVRLRAEEERRAREDAARAQADHVRDLANAANNIIPRPVPGAAEAAAGPGAPATPRNPVSAGTGSYRPTAP